MTEAISRAKLISEIEDYISEYEKNVNEGDLYDIGYIEALRTFKSVVNSEKLNLPTDADVREIEETVIAFIGADNDADYDKALDTLKINAGEWMPKLLAKLAEKEAEILRMYGVNQALHTELAETEAKLNQAVEALELIGQDTIPFTASESRKVARKALQAIKGEKDNVETATD